MKLVVLGTGTSQGIPVIGCDCEVCHSADPRDQRLRSSIYLEMDETHILIDIGPDFRAQMLNANLSKVDAILLTHEHNDHVAGVDDIRPVNFHYKNNIPIFGESRVLTQVRERFHYAFTEYKYPGAPTLELKPLDLRTFTFQGIDVTPIRVLHGELPILGFRIGDVAYLTDVKTIPEEEFAKLKNLDVLILSALRKSPSHFSHLTLEEAVDLAKRIGAKRTFLTHISHRMGRHEDIRPELPENIELAFDGLVVTV